MPRRRQERKESRGSGNGKNRYQMREKLVSIGDDFWIENAQGQKTFKVDGKALRVRQTLKFEDAHGKELCKIQERKVRVKDSMEVEDGPRVCVSRALGFHGFEHWWVHIAWVGAGAIQGCARHADLLARRRRRPVAVLDVEQMRYTAIYLHRRGGGHGSGDDGNVGGQRA